MKAEGTRPLNPVEFNFYSAANRCEFLFFIFTGEKMSDIKTYEYVWLDGFKPEPSMRSKIKATDLRGTDKGCLLYTSDAADES